MELFKDRDTIYSQINSDFEAIGSNNFSPISIGNILADNFSEHVSEIYNTVAEVEQELSPSRYTSERLTNVGARFGIKRESIVPLTDNTFSNFYFKLNGTTIAKDIAIDPTLDIIIPQGSAITGVNGELFFTRDAATFEPDDNKVYVRVYSTSDVVNTTIDTNVLTSNEIDLATVSNVDPDLLVGISLECNNEKAILSESTRLTDDEMRRLLLFEYNGLNNINEDKVSSAVLRVPGVSTVRVVEQFNGIGSTAVIIVPVNPLASEGVYVAVERSLEANVIGGESISVIRPEYLNVGIDLVIDLINPLENVDVFYNEIRFFVAGLVNAVPQGDILSPTNIINTINEVYSTQIQLVQITCITINGNRALIQNQQSFDDQKFTILDPSLDVGIN